MSLPEPYQKIFFENIEIRCSIGVYDHEKASPQRLRIQAEFYLHHDYQCDRDHVDECFDYDVLRKQMMRIASRQHFELQETLCHALMDATLAHDEVVAAKISTAKLDVYEDCAAVGYEVFRSKN